VAKIVYIIRWPDYINISVSFCPNGTCGGLVRLRPFCICNNGRHADHPGNLLRYLEAFSLSPSGIGTTTNNFLPIQQSMRIWSAAGECAAVLTTIFSIDNSMPAKVYEHSEFQELAFFILRENPGHLYLVPWSAGDSL
jgi:hypothetical protein